MKLNITETITLPEGVSATYANGTLAIKGPKGEVAKKIHNPQITFAASGNTLTLAKQQATRRHKRAINTTLAHITNMITGVQTPYLYQLKICSGHFPMNVAVSGENFIVKNFLGEKSPRTLKLKKGATVKVDGEIITVESCDKELAGNIASDIELLTVKRNRDLRVFQDGIYMTIKAGQEL